MGKRNRRYENETRYGRCEMCDADIPLKYFIERGDVVSCGECGAEYVIRALQPVRLKFLEEEHDV
jgi:alpha-aminoadipate/glutamate carrier protein LysW